MLKGLYVLKNSTQDKKNLGFRYDSKSEAYVYKFPVYKHKCIPLLICRMMVDCDTGIVITDIFKADGTLYAGYYNEEYGKSDVTKIVDENILKEFKKIGVKKSKKCQ